MNGHPDTAGRRLNEGGVFRLSYLRDRPMPYRVSDELSGELLGMFASSQHMHLFLAAFASRGMPATAQVDGNAKRHDAKQAWPERVKARPSPNPNQEQSQ